MVTSVKSEVYPMPMGIETFTITLDNLTNNSAIVGTLWEDVYVTLPFLVPTETAVLASIDATLNGTPTARDYYSAAVYFLEEGKNMMKPMTWINKAIEMSKDDPKFWMYRQQSLIYAKAGNKKGAIAAAKTSLELAKKANNADYVKMNTDSLKEWGAM